MNDETLKTYYQIITDTWKMLKAELAQLQPTPEYLEIATGHFVEYEQKWKYTLFWRFAGMECSAKLQEIERVWKAIREERKSEQNNQM